MVSAVIEGISIRQFAKRDGCNDKVVRRKIESGHLACLPDGKLDPALVGTGWRVRNRNAESKVSSSIVRSVRVEESPEKVADRAANIESDAPHSKAEAERIKENYLALLRQLEYECESRKVVEISAVIQAVAGEYARVRNRLLKISSRVSLRAAVLGTPVEVKAVVDEEVVLALQELTID